MFFYKIMPIFDIFACAMLLFGNILPADLVRFAGMYLIGKGLFFVLISRDIPSAVDFLFGIYLLTIAFFHFYNVLISLIGVVFIGQKAAMALALSH